METDPESRTGHGPPSHRSHLLQRPYAAGVLGQGEAHQAPQESHHRVRGVRAQVNCRLREERTSWLPTSPQLLRR